MINLVHRSTDFYSSTVFNHKCIDDFLKAKLESGIHTIWGYRFPIDFHLAVEEGKPLLIFLNGAILRSKFPTLPVFHGLRMMEGLGASNVSFSDPSLYAHENLGLGWFAGAVNFPLQEIFPIVIDKLIESTKASQVIFSGPSAGGFAAMALAVNYPKSLTFVWNPQTDIMKYSRAMVSKYTSGCYAMPFDQAVNDLPKLIKTNLIEVYKNNYSGNTVLYFQNLSDGHVRVHAEPFLKSISGSVRLSQKREENRRIAGGVWYFARNWGQGHVAPPGRVIRQVLRTMIQNSRTWPKLTRTGAIEPMLDRIFDGGGTTQDEISSVSSPSE